MTKLFLRTSCCLFILSQLSFSANAYSEKSIEACEKSQISYSELSQCFDRIKETKDRELQTWINNQIFILEEFALATGRGAPLDMFKRSQRNFITYRENDCRWQYLVITPAPGAAPAYKKCYILLTQDRINELSKIKI